MPVLSYVSQLIPLEPQMMARVAHLAQVVTGAPMNAIPIKCLTSLKDIGGVIEMKDITEISRAARYRATRCCGAFSEHIAAFSDDMNSDGIRLSVINNGPVFAAEDGCFITALISNSQQIERQFSHAASLKCEGLQGKIMGDIRANRPPLGCPRYGMGFCRNTPS